jgi:hypothetical protein
MKYIIIPIIKFVWAIILTIFIFFLNVFNVLIEAVWNATLTKGTAFEIEEVSHYDEDNCLSPYVEIPKRWGNRIYYKTYFHYIWGIKMKNENT